MQEFLMGLLLAGILAVTSISIGVCLGLIVGVAIHVANLTRGKPKR